MTERGTEPCLPAEDAGDLMTLEVGDCARVDSVDNTGVIRKATPASCVDIDFDVAPTTIPTSKPHRELGDGSSPGSGTTIMDGRRFDFTITDCAADEQPLAGPGVEGLDGSLLLTMTGEGFDSDRNAFRVEVDRTRGPGDLIADHIRVWQGDFRVEPDIAWEAFRSFHEESGEVVIDSAGDDVERPLLEVDGNRVQGSGSFEVIEGLEETGEVVVGSIEATCR